VRKKGSERERERGIKGSEREGERGRERDKGNGEEIRISVAVHFLQKTLPQCLQCVLLVNMPNFSGHLSNKD
jgi:hypothetical protein